MHAVTVTGMHLQPCECSCNATHAHMRAQVHEVCHNHMGCVFFNACMFAHKNLATIHTCAGTPISHVRACGLRHDPCA